MENLSGSNDSIEREQNEPLADYMQRLYTATVEGANSIAEAMQQHPVNFARMVNHIPDLIKEAQQLSGKTGEETQQ